ncbi:MaoC family dehydratase [Rhodocytophaga aerolata]|uniref:MaoC family dehydratase n=1 Tax=Rhodocytophaga aerolata TaxID=455078 RepID=A0ABT8R8U4_9BACT|nr:MaoC family dehydratase [Rhodocytophaga aerolata]MDO1447070.1 MaoC family dehydratase [Rhodocytophaga aerolata]
MEQGQTYTHEFTYSQQQVDQFAALTGDNNPLHLDAAYAAKTPFRKPIMHGFLGGSIFSKVLGTLFPGEGSIYLKQTMEFVNPMFVDVPYEAVFIVKEILPNSIALIETLVVDKASRTVLITGEALVRNKKIKRIKATSAE